MKKLLLIFGLIVGYLGVAKAISTCAWPTMESFNMHIDTRMSASDNVLFSFSITAAGDFVVDWGDGTRESITRPTSDVGTVIHSYSSPGTYTAKLTGLATEYSSDTSTAAIDFANSNPLGTQENLIGISGSLGYIFPILNETATGKPRFYETFYDCTNLTGAIPENLFAGISGAPASYMFAGTFLGCYNLTGAIPENLFSGISGAPASYMFENTFQDCSGLTEIPGGLFSGISGAPADNMFAGTFNNCSGLTGIPIGLFSGISGAPASMMFYGTFVNCTGVTGSIPSGLFSGISGAPATSMFSMTFYGCNGLTGSIPVGLFGSLSGTAQNGMFYQTFYGCTGLTGQSALMPDGITHLYEVWTDATELQVGEMYYQDTGLSDYENIPIEWGGEGVPLP